MNQSNHFDFVIVLSERESKVEFVGEKRIQTFNCSVESVSIQRIQIKWKWNKMKLKLTQIKWKNHSNHLNDLNDLNYWTIDQWESINESMNQWWTQWKFSQFKSNIQKLIESIESIESSSYYLNFDNFKIRSTLWLIDSTLRCRLTSLQMLRTLIF